jgi:hypothetical protein
MDDSLKECCFGQAILLNRNFEILESILDISDKTIVCIDHPIMILAQNFGNHIVD